MTYRGGLLITLGFLLLCPASLTHAATYYVATTGNDSTNSCSAAQNVSTPKRNISTSNGGISCLASGDKLLIRSGTYVEQILSYARAIPPGTSWATATWIGADAGETVTIRPTAGDVILDLNTANLEYVIFDHLILDGAAQCCNASSYIGAQVDHIRFQFMEIKNAYHSGALIPGHFNEFLDMNLHDNGLRAFVDGVPQPAHGMYMIGHDNVIDRCTFVSNAYYGLQIYNSGCSNCTNNDIVRNSVFHNNGTSGQSSAGMVLASGSGVQAYQNIVYSEFGGIEVSFDASNVIVYNNIIRNVLHNGIAIGNNVSNTQIYNNTIVTVGDSGIAVNSGAGATLRNNIVYGNTTPILVNGAATGTVQSNNLSTNPNFVNAGAFDFHLQASSTAAINQGFNLSGVFTTDFDGVTRPQGAAYDIGAYEYVSGVTPVAPSNLTTGGDAACNATAPTASFTPTANALVLACVVTEATPAITPTMTGNGLTWDQVATVLGSGNGIRTTLFRASGASPTTGAATITVSADQTNCTWAIAQFTGQDTSGTNGSGAIVQSATNFGSSTTSLAVNLGAFSNTNNATMGCFGISNNVVVTPGSGFAEVGAQATGFGSRAMNEFRADNATNVDVTFGTAVPAGIAVEIKQAAAAAAGRRRSGRPQQFLKAPMFPFFFPSIQEVRR